MQLSTVTGQGPVRSLCHIPDCGCLHASFSQMEAVLSQAICVRQLQCQQRNPQCCILVLQRQIATHAFMHFNGSVLIICGVAAASSWMGGVWCRATHAGRMQPRLLSLQCCVLGLHRQTWVLSHSPSIFRTTMPLRGARMWVQFRQS